jgi:hypothetical protein
MTTVTNNELNKLNYPLMTISPRYCNRLHNNPCLNPIKREVKEGSTAIFWGIYINLQTEMHKVRTLGAKTLLLVNNSPLNLWQRHRRNFGRHPTGVFLPSSLLLFVSGLPSEKASPGRPCWFHTSSVWLKRVKLIKQLPSNSQMSCIYQFKVHIIFHGIY